MRLHDLLLQNPLICWLCWLLEAEKILKNRNWHLCLAILIPDILGRTYCGVLPQSRPQKTAWALDSPGINPSNARSLGWCPSCHGSKLYFKLWWGSCERRGLLSLWVCTSVHLLLHLNCNLKRACLGSPFLGNQKHTQVTRLCRTHLTHRDHL